MSIKPQIIVICHCFRESETLVRKADKSEEKAYWRQR